MASEPLAVTQALDRLGTLANALGIRAVPLPGRHAIAAVTAYGIVGNGGFRYWYEGATETDIIAEAFAALGFDAAGKACLLSMDPFPGKQPFATLEAQREWMEAQIDDCATLFAFWESIDDPILSIRDALFSQHLVAFFAKHASLLDAAV